jgi:hypothetical protein
MMRDDIGEEQAERGEEQHEDDSDHAEPEDRRAHDPGTAAERTYLANLRLNLDFAVE